MPFGREVSVSPQDEDASSCHSSISSIGNHSHTLNHPPRLSNSNIYCCRETKDAFEKSSRRTSITSYDDEMAKMIDKLYLTRNNENDWQKSSATSLDMRETLIISINKLAKNVPACVLRKISRDSTDTQQKQLPPLAEERRDDNIPSSSSKLPYSETYQGALLFIDMSGFTKLAQILDVESLSKAINSYFQAIVDEVTTHGGDILKFAGDAIFAEWRIGENDEVDLPHSPPLSTTRKTNNVSEFSSGFIKKSTQQSESPSRKIRLTSSSRRPSIERGMNSGKVSRSSKQPSKPPATKKITESSIPPRRPIGEKGTNLQTESILLTANHLPVERETKSRKTKNASTQPSTMSIHERSTSSTLSNSISATNSISITKIRESVLMTQESNKKDNTAYRPKRPIPERRLESRPRRRFSITNMASDPASVKVTASSHRRRKTEPGGSGTISRRSTSIGRKSNTSKPRAPISRTRQRQPSLSDSSKLPTPKLSLEDCVHAAAVCGAMIVNKCTDYPIFANSVSGGKGPLVATLNVHCGLGVGEMAGIHVGSDSSRREYLIVGDPIDQVAEACDSAGMGEMNASGEALEYLNKGQVLKNQLQLDKNAKSKIIASRKKLHFSKRRKATWSLHGKIRKPVQPNQESFQIPFDNMDTANLKAFQRTLSLYVHPVVIGDELSEVDVPGTSNGKEAQDQIRAEAELRSVFTIFIMPKITAKLTDNNEDNKKTFKQLDDIMNVVTAVLESYNGHLRQYIVDDKGIVLIATFGLRGSTFPDMVAERALPTCRLIHSALQEELGVDSKVGATLGKVYCGVVGGLNRHEYAVLGPSVNLAARLMASKNNPGVMVDNEVRKKAKGMNFISFPPVKAKGYADLVPVYKPLTSKEARWGRVNPKFVGRQKETNVICKLALNMAKEGCPSKVLFVWGDSGSGKSAFVVQAISKARKMLILKKKRFVITRNISSEGDSLVPFSLFRSIFRDVLSEKPFSDDATLFSQGSYIVDKAFGGSSIGSYATFGSENANAIERLNELCEELKAPEGFLEIVGQHLLGDAKGKIAKVENAPEVDAIISFMAQVFIKSTSHAEGVILALDDVQWMDSLSWRVLECIYETSKNILMVCGSRLESHPLSIDKRFLAKLTGEGRNNGLYSEMTIAELGKDDIREMAAITLSCEPNEVDDKFCNDVFTHSGGMPYFTSEILENCVRKGQCVRLKSGKIGWKEGKSSSRDGLQFANIEELLLQRLDNFNELTRKVLYYATILGMEFLLEEILELACNILSIDDDAESIEAHILIRQALSSAVSEGILYEVVEDDATIGISRHYVVHSTIHDTEISTKSSDDNSFIFGDIRYSFSHDSWRRVIVSLLLDSYVQDIHRHAAIAIEARIPDNDMRDYRTKVKLFSHWKGSDDTINAGKVALDVGMNFKLLGMNSQSAHVYADTINMWKRHEPPEGEERIAGFSPLVLDSLDEENLVTLIKLQTGLGQAIGSVYSGDLSESAEAFRSAVSILEAAPISVEVKDRSFIFPIYSGMFFLLKYGAFCEPSEQVETELDLVAKFVRETEIHGDPVHYGRALAMQGETCRRIGHFEEAIKSHMKLKEVYDVDKHSARVVASYASDRCAQNFGCTASCYMCLGQADKALEIADYIEYNLMPKMDPKNVHNSAVMVFPILWILKDKGMIDRARKILEKFVQEPFDAYYGEDGSTPFLSAFKPYKIFFEISSFMDGELEALNEEYYCWALDLNNMENNPKNDAGIGLFGRSPMSVSAEICLRLSKLIEDPEKKRQYIENGMKLSQLALSGCDGSGGIPKSHTPFAQIKPVFDELQALMLDKK